MASINVNRKFLLKTCSASNALTSNIYFIYFVYVYLNESRDVMNFRKCSKLLWTVASTLVISNVANRIEAERKRESTRERGRERERERERESERDIERKREKERERER